MKSRRFMIPLLVVAVFLLMCNIASFAETVVTVMVSADGEYVFGVDETGTILTATKLAADSGDEATYTFDENGNLVIVVPQDVDLTEDFEGKSIVEGINAIAAAGDFTFEVVTDPNSAEVNAFLTGLINGEEEEPAKNPNASRFEKAEELGITNGKMHLIEKLEVATDDDTFDEEEWADMPVKDIMKETKNNKKESK